MSVAPRPTSGQPAQIPPAGEPGRRRFGFLSDAVISAALISAIAGLVGSIAGPIATALMSIVTEAWTAPALVYGSTETILVNGRVVNAVVTNAGRGTARDVVVVMEVLHPTFRLGEEHQRHVHTFPPVPVETSVRGARMEVKLTRPLGSGQTVTIVLDDVAFKEHYEPMFLASVSSDRGQATNQGHRVQSFPSLTLNQYLSSVRRPGEGSGGPALAP